jgi:hypothetical protein
VTDEEREEAKRLAVELFSDDALTPFGLDVFLKGFAAGRDSLRAELIKIQELREKEFFDHSREIAQALKELEAERAKSEKLVEFIKSIERKLTQLSVILRTANKPENICIAEHDAVLIAIGYLNAKKAIAEYETNRDR